MKKTLRSIVVTTAAFFFGVFTEGAARFGQSLFQKVEAPAQVEIEDVQTPIIYFEPLNYEENQVEEAEEFRATPSGYYYSEKEKEIAAFNGDITIIHLFVHWENGKQIAVGSIYDEVIETGYEQAELTVTAETFNLRTKKVRGVEYEFEGRFLKNGFVERFDYGEKVLKGKLQKFVNGRKVKEIKSKFIFEYESCGGGGQ